jgi:hypothetical protein
MNTKQKKKLLADVREVTSALRRVVVNSGHDINITQLFSYDATIPLRTKCVDVLCGLGLLESTLVTEIEGRQSVKTRGRK